MSLEDTYDALRERADEIAKDLSSEEIEGLQSPGDGDPWRLFDLDLLEYDEDLDGDGQWHRTMLGRAVLEIVEKRA